MLFREWSYLNRNLAVFCADIYRDLQKLTLTISLNSPLKSILRHSLVKHAQVTTKWWSIIQVVQLLSSAWLEQHRLEKQLQQITHWEVHQCIWYSRFYVLHLCTPPCASCWVCYSHLMNSVSARCWNHNLISYVKAHTCLPTKLWSLPTCQMSKVWLEASGQKLLLLLRKHY